MKTTVVIANDRRERSNLKALRLLRRLRLLAMTFALLLRICSAFAYTDEIRGVGLDEAWQAARKVLEPVGIKKSDEKKGILKSRWMEDEVVRRNSLFKGITSQVYRRRSQMEISFKELKDSIEVSVKGTFEEKPADSRAAAPWRKLKTQMEDYDLERIFFMRILAQLAKDRSHLS